MGVAKPTRADYAAVVEELNKAKLVVEASFFERRPHFPVTHMDYFKPNKDAFMVELKSKDRRSGKEWEHVNGSGVWVEKRLISLEGAKEFQGTPYQLGQILALAEKSFKAAFEVLSMRSQYFCDIT